MLNKSNKTKKLLAIILLILTVFSVAQPIFAVSGTGRFVGGQFDSGMKTTDNQNKSTGVIIRKLINNTTGEKMTVFCAEYGVEFKTDVVYNGQYYTPIDGTVKKACKVAYFGWYSKYPTYVVDGGILAADMKWVKQDYVFTQQYIWEVLGQSSASFIDATIQSQYQAFKADINNKIDNMQRKPSFSDKVTTVDAGTTTVLTDTNGVLADYNSIDKTINGIRFVHNQGENTLTITVDSNCTIEDYRITDEMMLQWGLVKDASKDNDTSIYFSFTGGSQNQLMSMHYNDPVTLAMNLKINSFGKLEIAKKDNKGNYVPNTSFKLSYNADMSNDIGTYKTGSNGKVVVEKLRKGTIYIQETEVPEHLILDTTIRSAEIRVNETTSYEATNNWKQGYIKVIKKDKEENKIVKRAGVVFDIYNSNNQKVTSITTDENGVAMSGLLDYGSYYVKESKAPYNYTIEVEASENIEIIEDGKTYETSIANIRVRGKLLLSKEDSKTGKEAQGEATLRGAVYGLYTRTPILSPIDNHMMFPADTKLVELSTDKDGNASLGNIPLGEYYVKEITASEGYTLDDTKYNFDLTYENQNVSIVTSSVTVKERVKSQAFRIIKVSSDENGEAELLKGVEFTIKSQKDIDKYGSWEKAPIAKNANGEESSILVTDEKGYAVSERLPYGTYVVRETKVPDNKYKVPDFTVEITEDSDEPQTWRVFNDTSFRSILAIVKQDVETQKTIKISGAKFKIKNIETGEYFGYWSWNPLPQYVNTWETDETGTVMTGEQLPVGKYQLEEIKSPKGYLISSTPVEFEIASNIAYETLPDRFDTSYNCKTKRYSSKR